MHTVVIEPPTYWRRIVISFRLGSVVVSRRQASGPLSYVRSRDRHNPLASAPRSDTRTLPGRVIGMASRPASRQSQASHRRRGY